MFYDWFRKTLTGVQDMQALELMGCFSRLIVIINVNQFHANNLNFLEDVFMFGADSTKI